ncbi:uncharacterized protein LOC116308316 [Actinia tenebrosa]|uniref:Uncharacterized protein LOC116308316 n=1 Tax=Actinia tenebrosa TaxID=6105 RepID=A0A6P8J3H8_ACTTE|nr:uncharacterized protein LOC116308316 [Actinia tenebrosa]XP_031574567.1 uncharacterized protein LOC116308316 [Actinia tenebrosa]
MKWFLCAVLVVLMKVSYSAKIVYRENDAYGGCVMKDVVEKVGCYRDNGAGGSKPRPLTEELVNIRDPTNPVYVKDLHLDWNNWQGSLDGLVCECAKRAAAKGYKFIGLQFYGECWSGPNSEDYAQDGEASTCIRQYFTPCDVYNEEHPCAGEAFTNYVYSVKNVYLKRVSP